MKVVILAGGYGTRISEESHLKPKPMIEIGGKPILWHIMKTYSYYGYNDFIICLGYKGYVIKEYFAHYFLHESDITFDFNTNKQTIHHVHAEPWKVTLVNTGLETMTGGRLKRVKEYLNMDEPFMFTYGDGVSNVNINELVESHNKHDKLATVTTVQPSGRFGALDLTDDNMVKGFQEKPKGDGGWINAGYFVLDPKVLNYIENDETIFEQQPLINLALDGQLQAFKHNDFWQPMDTVRDKKYLEELLKNNEAPWKLWE